MKSDDVRPDDVDLIGELEGDLLPDLARDGRIGPQLAERSKPMDRPTSTRIVDCSRLSSLHGSRNAPPFAPGRLERKLPGSPRS